MLFGGLCLITDRRLSSLPMEEAVKRALDGGVRWIQYREKELSRREIYFTAERLRKLTEEYGAVFVVNDHLDIAMAVDADGVHLGQDDLLLEGARRVYNRIIGISTHNTTQARDAEDGGADYIGFGPVFSTTTKEGALSPRGLERLREVVEAVLVPVVAIGGINLENLSDVLQTGVQAVAVASAILSSPDIYKTSREFVNIINR